MAKEFVPTAFRPRNNYVLIRIVELGETESGIAVPDTSLQGKEFLIEDFGPDVKDLQKGDKVFMHGTKNVTYSELPNRHDLIVMEEKYVILTNRKYESKVEFPELQEPYKSTLRNYSK